MNGIVALAHVAIRVKDIDRSLDFYVNRLGLEEMFRLDRDGKLWIVYLRITDDQYLELFPEGDGDRAPGPDTIGLNHVCLGVVDMDSVLAQLAATGISLFRPKKLGVDGNHQAWVQDPDGNRIELMEVAPDCMQLEAIARLRAARR